MIKLRGSVSIASVHACFLLLFMCAYYGSAEADELYCPNLKANDKDVASLLAFGANDFCNALVEGFKIGTSACVDGHSPDESGWIVEVSRERLGYHNNYNVLLIGPSDRLDGYVSGGFEKYQMAVLTFIGLNCEPAYYAVIYGSMYHTGSFSEARKESDANWKAFSSPETFRRRDELMGYVGDYVRRDSK